VLVLSDEPFVPWELADARPGMHPPPVTVRIDGAAFVSGHYTGQNGYKALPGAEREVEQVAAALTERTPPAHVVRIEASESQLVAFLNSKPEAHLLHFSMHGRFDPAFRENGLITIEAKPVSFFLVRSSKFPAGPFVFLNACQVGQGQEVLSGFASMPDAFLTAGAAAVVAPIWAVDDEISHRFAIDFYRAALLVDRIFAGAQAPPPWVQICASICSRKTV
jgi:CHAT domain-containing protein